MRSLDILFQNISFTFCDQSNSQKRLIQMGEIKNIYIIGSPDLDILLGNSLPLLENVKQRYV